MALVPVRMPKWGLSMQEGTITAWHVAPGQPVARGAELCDIETAKIANAFAAPETGVLARCLAAAGAVVPVGRLIAVLATGPADEAEIDALVQAEEAAAPHAAIGTGQGGAAGPGIATVATSRGRIAYLATGDAGAGTGAGTVVLLHGFGGGSASWAAVAPGVARRCRVIAFDLPGHGASTRDVGDGSPDALAAPLAEALATLGAGPFHLAAHSFGAAVARALLRRSSAVTGTTLISPAGAGAPVDAGYVRGFAAARRKRELRPLMQRLFARPEQLGRDVVAASLALLDDDATRAALATIAHAIAAAGPGAPDWPGDRPWQVIWGGQDHIIPLLPDVAAALGPRLHLLPQCGHMPPLEAPEAVADRIIASIAD